GETAGTRRPAPSAQLDLAAALEEQLADQEAPPLRDEDDAPQTGRAQSCWPSTWRARLSPSSGLVEGTSFAFTCGVIPVPLIAVPFGVGCRPTARPSAPPLLRGITSWKVPLPNDVVPTTLAVPDCSSAAVTISEAEAVSPSISTTIGRRGSASPVASSVLLD